MSFTHINERGEAAMVDISEKAETAREARAEAFVKMQLQTLQLLEQQQLSKGDVLAVARVAGIQGAKQCSTLIPLCHPLMLSKVTIDFTLDTEQNSLRIESRCKIVAQTGVEMEALTAVSVAALTVYDMCKAVDKTMEISGVKVLSKSGGKSADWGAPNSD